MSATAYTDPALEVRPASSFVAFLAAFADLARSHGANVAEVEAALASGEADIKRGIEATARLVTNSRIAAERGEPVAWDYLIDRLEFYEAEAARELSQIRRLVDRLLTFLGGAPPAERRRARALARLQEDAVVRFVEGLRDARWQAMAARAHFDPAAHGGPVVNDIAELRRYLASF
ncbi:MAG: hypothetical protein JO081_08515 [Alphaproteobacteria bacterium]|nr:hypothetical protein [Alphaproteobacteria bacterium]